MICGTATVAEGEASDSLRCDEELDPTFTINALC